MHKRVLARKKLVMGPWAASRLFSARSRFQSKPLELLVQVSLSGRVLGTLAANSRRKNKCKVSDCQELWTEWLKQNKHITGQEARLFVHLLPPVKELLMFFHVFR